MGKFIVTGLHSSGKSAFIRSFASDNDAKLFKNISQAQRSTRFIAEWRFKVDCGAQIEVIFKSRERVVDEVIENIRREICPADEVGEPFDSKKQKEIENKKLGERLKQFDTAEWKQVIYSIFRLGISKFINLNEFVKFVFTDEDYESIRIKDDAGQDKKPSQLTMDDIKDLIGNAYGKCIKENKLIIQKDSGSILGNVTNSDSLSNCDDTFMDNVKMLFCVPKTKHETLPYFSGVVEKAIVTVGINTELIDDSNHAKYSFMADKDGNIDFTLFDSFGLDHGAQNTGDDAQGIILNAYRNIISEPDIDGVILLGTVSYDIEDSQSATQQKIVPYIVSYNLSEKPGLNVIYILNHADLIDDISCDRQPEIIADIKEEYESIKETEEIKALGERFQEGYINHSVDNFLESICIYSAIPNDSNKEIIKSINTKTFEKIDRICKTFNRYGITWNAKLLKESLPNNNSDSLLESVSNYISSSIKIISAKKKIDKLEDNKLDYYKLSRQYRSLIRWNTAEAVAGQWRNLNFGSSYDYTGKALNIGSYSDDVREAYEIDQHPRKILEKHLIALFNYYCKVQNNPYYPYTYDNAPFDDKQNGDNGNRFIFIQKCMYDAIFEFVRSKEIQGFLAERINSLLGSGSIDRYKVEAMNNSVKDIQLSDEGIAEIEEVFKNIFKEKVETNYEAFHKLAIDDEIRERLLNLFGEKKSEYKNSTIREIIAGVVNNILPSNLANLELPDMLKPRLRDMINEMQIIPQ